jgi:hypothetical protein
MSKVTAEMVKELQTCFIHITNRSFDVCNRTYGKGY